MALKLYDTLTPDGDYPLMKAQDVEMPDGTRLSDFEGGGGSVSWEDMPDKPFYEEQDREEILAETTLELESEPYIEISPSPFILVEGEKYLVVWNGVEHECVCVLDTVLHSGQPCLTDFSENAEGATGNFIIVYCSPECAEAEGGIAVFQTFTGLGTHTVAIYQDTTVIKYLNNKYLEILEGEDKIEVEILPEQTITLEADDADNPSASLFGLMEENTAQASTMAELNVGDICKVTWRGEEYYCEVQDLSYTIPDNTGAIYHKYISLGNVGIVGVAENTGEPFVLAIQDVTVTQTEERLIIFSIFAALSIAETTYDVTLSITKVSGGYKIKEEHLPDMTSLIAEVAGTLIENANKPATAVDLTAFESDGIIVETYADGSTVTTTMERNAEGKITKITDSNGNVTVLTR